MTTEPISFSAMRFIAGLGIGGVMPTSSPDGRDDAPRKIRSVMTTLMFSGYALGGILAAVLGKQLIGDWLAVGVRGGRRASAADSPSSSRPCRVAAPT